eukprot:3418689-Prymnesium_polylepis.1
MRPVRAEQLHLLRLQVGAPRVRISNVRLVRRLTAEGGELRLVDCSLEPVTSGPNEGGRRRRLSAPASQSRALSIVGGGA